MAQFARPDSDVTQASFTGGFAAIDEASPSDLDYAYGANNTAAELEVGLSNVTDPNASTGHTFRFRVAKTNNGTVDGAGNAVTITPRLMQGATLIYQGTPRTCTETWTTYSETLDGGSADLITDYTDLRLEFVTSQSGGNPSNRRGGAVSWAELEVPDAAEQHQGSFAVTGGGVVTAAGRKEASAPLAVTGGGTVPVGQSTERTRSLGVTGGGVVSVSASSERVAGVVVTGGGVVTIVGQQDPSERTGSFAVTGGGSVVVVATKEALRGVVLTGSGVVTLSARKDASAGLAVTGGGSVVLAAATERRASVVLTGGGAVVWGYEVTQGNEKTGSFAVTGGGRVVVGARSERDSAVVVTGGGTLLAVAATERGVGIAVAGGGTVRVEGSPEKRGGIVLTGGGRVTWTGTSAVPTPADLLAQATAAAQGNTHRAHRHLLARAADWLNPTYGMRSTPPRVRRERARLYAEAALILNPNCKAAAMADLKKRFRIGPP